MASNDAAATATIGASNQSTNVSIRVIALAHATNENEDLYLVVDLDTSISQLKERLQQNLSNHPQPATQRLIYQGRPLTDGNAVLRNILRLDPAGSNNAPVHVLHLVVRETQPITSPNTNPAQSTQAQPSGPPTDRNQTPSTGRTLPPGLDFMQHAFPQGHPANAAIQNIMQQHMANVTALHHQQHHRAHNTQHEQNQQDHQGHQQQHQSSHQPPNSMQQPHVHQMHHHLPHQNMQHNSMNDHQPPFAIPNLNLPPPFARIHPGHPQPQHVPGTQLNAQSSPTTPGSRQDPAHIDHGSDDVTNAVQGSYTMTIEEIHGPNGERTRRVVRNGPMLPAHMNPVERSASAPGSVLQPTSVANHLQPNPLLPHPFPMMPHLPAPVMANLPTPFPRFPAVPTALQANAGSQVRDPTLFLVSSPTGPEALLITPNHGYFSSSQQAFSTSQGATQTNTNSHGAANSQRQPTPVQTPQQGRDQQNNNQAQVAIRPQQAAPGEIQAQAQPARREGEDLIALALQRGWLFLRLYMFIFVLSEPGTWRRYILLIIASLVCLLPRNNPFTDLFQAARRHFDNLIGPPQPAALVNRPQTNGQQATRNDTNRTAADPNTPNSIAQSSTDTSMPTPEQNARRLIREHQQRNPNAIRETMYRIEQGVALFLASLIPGVGERHVRAREEARRMEQEEDQRRRRDNETNSEQRAEEDDSSKQEAANISSDTLATDQEISTASATGADTSAAAPSSSSSSSTAREGLRLRDTGASVSAAST